MTRKRKWCVTHFFCLVTIIGFEVKKLLMIDSLMGNFVDLKTLNYRLFTSAFGLKLT